MSHHHYSHDPEDHHFHRNHYHEPPPPPPPPPPCCNTNSSCYCSSAYYYYPPPPPPPQAIPIPIPTPTTSTSDQLLHAIAAHLLLQSTSSPSTQTAPQPQPPPPPIDTSTATTNLNSYYLKRQPFPNPQPKDHQNQQHLLYYSLLRRISALEYSISHLHNPPKPHFPPPPPPRHRHSAADSADGEADQKIKIKIKSKSFPPPSKPQRPSVQELAARTIQTHFRHFLVRRSQTLRQLKHLAIIKSRAASLKASVAEHNVRRRGDPAAVSEAALALLFQLDAIQGDDPMIREGKRAISRELSRILEFVDKVLVKEHERMVEERKEMEIREDDGNGTRNEGIMRNQALLAKRRVSFVGDGEEVSGLHELAEDVDEDEDEEEKRFECLEEPEKTQKGSRRGNSNAKPGLSAPVQVHTESRRMPVQKR